MDTLYWINSNLKHNIKKTNKLFFNEYNYGASGLLQEVNTVRGLDFAEFEERLHYKQKFKHQLRYMPIRTLACSARYYEIKDLHNQAITENTKQNLTDFLNLLLDARYSDTKYRLTISNQSFYCYSNNLSLLS